MANLFHMEDQNEIRYINSFVAYQPRHSYRHFGSCNHSTFSTSQPFAPRREETIRRIRSKQAKEGQRRTSQYLRAMLSEA